MLLQNLKVTTAMAGSMTNALDLTTPQSDIVKKYEHSYSDGTAADQAQLVFSDTRPLASSTNESLDLSGALGFALGGVISFTALKEIIVVAAAANTGDLRVGAADVNGFTGPVGAAAVGMLVAPGGMLNLHNPSAAGWAVTGGTGDLLRVENLVAAAAAYDIILVGEGTVA